MEDATTSKEWVADPAANYTIPDGLSQVDSYDKDGTSASGSATFVDVLPTLSGANPLPVQGSFEVSCAK